MPPSPSPNLTPENPQVDVTFPHVAHAVHADDVDLRGATGGRVVDSDVSCCPRSES